MITQNTGYYPANPQTRFMALGCALAILGMALGFGLLMLLGMMG